MMLPHHDGAFSAKDLTTVPLGFADGELGCLASLHSSPELGSYEALSLAVAALSDVVRSGLGAAAASGAAKTALTSLGAYAELQGHDCPAMEAQLWHDYGSSLQRDGRLELAQLCFDKALDCVADHRPSLLARARLFASRRQFESCLDDLTRLLTASPLGQVLEQEVSDLCAVAVGRAEASAVILVLYEQLCRLPSCATVLGLRLICAQRLALWATETGSLDYSQLMTELEHLLRAQHLLGKECLPEKLQSGMKGDSTTFGASESCVKVDGLAAHLPHPLVLSQLYDSPALLKKASEHYLLRQTSAPTLEQLGSANENSRRAYAGLRRLPLRVAYFSDSLCDSALGWQMLGVLARHNKRAVEVTLVNTSQRDADSLTRTLQTLGHTWLDAGRLSDSDLVYRCEQLAIDVAIDLNGLQGNGRPGVFMRRVAPLQIRWLGYPGSMPGAGYDYMLADPVTIDQDLRPYISENVIYLARSSVPADLRGMGESGAQERSTYGLPTDALVICCFCDVTKITPEVWAVWMRALRAVPKAVLWLAAPNQETCDNFRASLRGHEVSPSQLIFAPRVGNVEHRRRLRLADLSLDTFPCASESAAAEALEAGVTHLSCIGRTLSSRRAASVLHGVGMDFLICSSLQEYEARLLELLTHPSERNRVKLHLGVKRVSSPFFDASAFTRQLEDALCVIYDRARRGLMPSDIWMPGAQFWSLL